MRLRATCALLVWLAAAPALAGQNAVKADPFQAAMGMARVKRDAGDVAAARKYFEEARRIRAFDAAELAEYFWVLAGKDSAAALAVGREALLANPDNRDLRDRAITEAIAVGDEAVVVALAKDGQKRQPQTAVWPRRAAQSFQRQAQPASAAAAFLEATHASDVTTEDKVGLATTLEAAKRYAEAVEAWAAVPESARQGDDAQHSRLRALALSNHPSAGAELDAWVGAHSGDAEMRALAIETAVHDGDPAKALTLLEPFTTGPAAETWIRRKVSIARAAGSRKDAISALDMLRARHAMKDADRLALVELMLEDGQVARATDVLKTMSASSGACDAALFGLIDRISGDAATRLLIDVMSTPKCTPSVTWLRRAIDRSVAAQNHQTALDLLARVPDAQVTPELRRLTGQLQFWTGKVPAAIRTLEAVVTAAPGDVIARDTLVDAYRADHRPAEAWRTAEPMLDNRDLTTPVRNKLAELALEVDRPSAAVSVLKNGNGFPPADLLARAFLAAGQPAEALGLLKAIPPAAMTPVVALSYVDALAATSGSEAARAAAQNFTETSPAWRDFLSRKVTLEARTGHVAESTSLRAVLAKVDPQAAAIADVEIALAAGRPQEALALIGALPNDPQSDRVADLESIARAGTGDVTGALAIVERLKQGHPESVSLRVREADLRYRATPSDATLSALVQLRTAYPLDQTVAVTTGRALANSGRSREALAVLADVRDSSDDIRTLRSGLLVRAAAEDWAAGRRVEAKQEADLAVSLDPHTAQAWFILLDATAGAPNHTEFDGVLRRFESVSADQPTLVIGMSEKLSAFVRSHDDPLVSRAVSWLDAMKTTDPAMSVARDVARARVLSAAENWPAALDSVEKALKNSPASSEALKLRAELLSWSGQHAEAVNAYRVYLKVNPQDVDAWRQQARVAGWGGFFSEAKHLYADLARRLPDDTRVVAEAAAKTAYYDGRWQAAVSAYDHWLALEPENGEARFERAESLRAAGDGAGADAALIGLDTTARHRLARPALNRARTNRATTVNAIADVRSSNGYEGQRLLDFRQFGAGLHANFGSSTRTALTAEGTQIEALGGDERRDGYRAGLSGTLAISRSLTFGGRAQAWDFSRTNSMLADLSAEARWKPGDRWTLAAGAERTPLFENMMTIADRISASGGFGAASFDSPRTTLDVRVARQNLSDGNARQRATMSVSQALGDHWKPVRLIGWAESLHYRTAATGYFSPDHQFRADAGLEYTHTMLTPRFRGDRQQMFAASYLIGIDDRGTTYHHPMLRLSLEFANGLALEGRAGWIRSDVYRETSLFAGLTMRPGGHDR